MPIFDMEQGEHLLLEGSANKSQTFGNKGGKLYLTNHRLVFVAHALNFGSKFDEVSLSSIRTIGNTFMFHTTTNLVSFNIGMETKEGETLLFVVTRKQKDLWIEKINQAILEYVTEKITIPETVANDIAPSKPQIKVISCEGCGACVVVLGEALTKCDYCSRPTVG